MSANTHRKRCSDARRNLMQLAGATGVAVVVGLTAAEASSQLALDRLADNTADADHAMVLLRQAMRSDSAAGAITAEATARRIRSAQYWNNWNNWGNYWRNF